MELRIPMQPTMRPPGLSWPINWNSEDGYRRRRVRLTLEDLADLGKIPLGLNYDWGQISHQQIVYVPKNLRHRFENSGSSGRAASGLTFPTSDGSWRPDRNLIDTASWRIPDLKVRLQAAGATGAAGGPLRWEGSAWAVGALLLALLVLLVRAVEKCLHRKFYKTRRRRRLSEEWPTANVLATSQQANDHDIPPRLDDSDAFQSEVNQDSHNNDLPPPYSECANAAGGTVHDASKYIGLEEPPPPYSACYVAYSNPKDGIPSVHFCNRQRENLFQDISETAHSSNDTGLNERNEPKPESSDDAKELVFHNGRVIEIPSQGTEGNVQDDRRDDVCIVNMNSGRQDNSSTRPAVVHTVSESQMDV